MTIAPLRAVLPWVLFATAIGPLPAQVTRTVDAQADIFAAGLTTLPPLGSPGLLPSEYLFGASAAPRALTFAAVTGGWWCFVSSARNGPDGDSCANSLTNLNSFDGIAGIVSPRTMFLVGVFLGAGGRPAVAPARLDFFGIGLDFASLSPQIGQVFFIGDGRTGSGAVQRFLVPTDATRLYLGIADGSGFVGVPGAYGDNVGSVEATFSVGAAAPSAVPEPVGVLLLGSGLAGMAVMVRRRRTP